MKIGIVGLGSIGKRHLENARKLGHEVDFCDPAFKDRQTRTLTGLIDWCDAAVIATPSHLHEEGLRACVERGKHCLIEKPLGTDIGKFPELLAEADDKKLAVRMGNNLRYHPGVSYARCIANPLWANFICATKTDKPTYLSDGVVLCTGSHEVDMALDMFGPGKLMTATGVFDETVDFVIRHDNGVRSSFHLDFITPVEVRQLWIGAEGACTLIDLPERVVLTRYPSGNAGTTWDAGSYDDDYRAEMEDFIRATHGLDSMRGATGWEGLAVLKILVDVRQRVAFPNEVSL